MNQRKNSHLAARDFMMNDDYSSAALALEAVIEKHGPHVLVLSDLASSYYMSGQMDLFSKSFYRFSNELDLVKSRLSSQTFLKALLIQGKFHEEMGSVAIALENYSEGLEVAKFEGVLNLEQKFAIQLLRLKSWLNDHTDLHQLYKTCSNYSEISVDLMPELEHGLMLAEQILFGNQTALGRLDKAIGNRSYLKSDIRLMHFDLLEVFILQNQNLKAFNKSFVNTDVFEDVLLKFQSDTFYKIKTSDLSLLSRNMSSMCLMRILIMSLHRSVESEDFYELKRRLLFMIDSLDSASQKLLRKKWILQFDHISSNGVFCMSKRELRIGSRSLSLSGSFAFEFINHIIDRNVIATDELIQYIYGIPMSESSYARLKTAIQRLNRELEVALGTPKAFDLSKDFVRLNGAWKKTTS